MIDELNELLQPIIWKCGESELRAIVEAYILRRDINAWYWNQNGRIHINQNKGVIGSLVSFSGYCLENGDIRLVPQVNYEALQIAIWELKLWRNALLPPAKQDGIPAKDSDHWAYSTPKKRAEIVEHYRRAREAGEVSNKETWAQSEYGIRARTLRRYEVEYDKRPDT